MYEYGVEMTNEHLTKLFVKREIDFDLTIKKFSDIAKVKDLLSGVYHTNKLAYEEAYIFVVNGSGRVFGVIVANACNLENTKIDVRMLLMFLSLTAAKLFFIVHNHPEKGDYCPSKSDFDVTDAMEKVGIMFEVPFLGSYIINADRFIKIEREEDCDEWED